MTSTRPLLPIVVAFVCATPGVGQSVAISSQRSDLQRAGLRGAVEECDTETIIPSRYEGDGKTVTELKYNPDGSIYQLRDDEGSRSISYDAQGRILAEVPDRSDSPAVTYTYDSQDRLVAINGEGDWFTTFEYDGQGRKTRIVKSSLQPSSPYRTEIPGEVDIFPMGEILLGVENQDMDGIPPDGGQIRTLFNDSGQATESQVFDLDGELTGRLNETYDAKGRTVEFSEFEIRFVFLFPGGRDLLAANPAAYDGVKYELTGRLSYIYDDQDRVVEKRDYDGLSHETTITKITYNDHGDESQEIETKYDGDLNQPQGTGGASLSGEEIFSRPATQESNVVQFTYQYDPLGNWVQETVSSPAHANESSQTWSITHRKIIYY